MMVWPSLRGLLRARAFTASAVLALALGIGANTGAFSALRTLLWKPLPYPAPERLVSLYETAVDAKPRGVAVANLLDWRRRTTLFDAMAAWQPRSFGLTLRDGGPVNVIQTGMVMAGFFQVTGVPPARGRVFREDEEIAEARVLVLTDRLWRQAFGAADAIGREVFLNEEPFTVIGVMPAGFEYPMDRVLPDAFLPLSRRDYCCGRLGSQDAAARLKPGVSIEAARAELASVAAGLAREYPATNAGRSTGVRPLAEALGGGRREPLFLLGAASLALLLIACANAAGLVLARCLGRTHEIAIRASMGAGLAGCLAPFLVEAAAIAAAGGAAGLVAAQLVLRMVPALAPGAAQAGPLRLDGAAFGFAFLLALGMALLLAGAPAVLLRRANFAALLKLGGRAHSRAGHARLRSALVVAEVALGVTLLLGAGVLLRSLLRLAQVSPGFETAHALRFGIGLPEKRYSSEEKLIAFHRDLTAQLAALPGVRSVGAVGRLPLRGGAIGPGGSFQIAGSNLPIPQRPRAWIDTASPGYFEAMGIPLVEGRGFSWRDDRPGAQRVAVVNQSFARAYLRTRPRLGTLLDLRWISELNPAGSQWEIVGVVGDTRQANMDREPIPEVFLSWSQIGADGGSYVVRAGAGVAGLPQAIAAAVARADPRLERISVTPLELVIEGNLAGRRAAIRMVGAFGALALLLAAVGVYGIVAFRAAERSREMAIRMALGATPREVRSLVLGHGLRLAAAGAAMGLAAFVPASRLLESQVYGVSAADPLAMAAAALLVMAAALATSLVPARRAAAAAPMDLLRDA